MESQAIVLMPYYQTERSLFGKSLQSFLDQDYQNKKLVIYIDNDKKNENDLNSILDNLDEKQKKQIVLIGGKRHNGLAEARNELLKYVKEEVDDNAIIFQLDSDDCYTSNNVISNIVENVEKSGANVAILNFKYGFYDGKTEDKGLKTTKEQTGSISKKYTKAKYFEPEEDFKNLTSLGWTKVYTAKLFKKLPPVAGDGKYEDFVYMALFCFDNIKVVGVESECITFNKYSSSITSTRTEKDCKDIVDRLNEFWKYLQTIHNETTCGPYTEREKKKKIEQIAKDFINGKTKQYESIFEAYDRVNETKLLGCFKEYLSNLSTKNEEKQCQM